MFTSLTFASPFLSCLPEMIACNIIHKFCMCVNKFSPSYTICMHHDTFHKKNYSKFVYLCLCITFLGRIPISHLCGAHKIVFCSWVGFFVSNSCYCLFPLCKLFFLLLNLDVSFCVSITHIVTHYFTAFTIFIFVLNIIRRVFHVRVVMLSVYTFHITFQLDTLLLYLWLSEPFFFSCIFDVFLFVQTK